MELKFENIELFYRVLQQHSAIFFITTQSYWETKNDKITFLLFLMGAILVAVASLGGCGAHFILLVIKMIN